MLRFPLMTQGDVAARRADGGPRDAPDHHERCVSPVSRRPLTAGCLFSGMGGFASGLADAGFAISWANDNDAFACAAFRHRFPRVPVVESDVCSLSVQRHDLAPVDVLAGGFPCQSFSQAGDRRGFEDPMGKLFFEIPRLLGEYEPRRRPALVVFGKCSSSALWSGRSVVRSSAARAPQGWLLVPSKFMLDGKRNESDRFAARPRTALSGGGVTHQILA